MTGDGDCYMRAGSLVAFENDELPPGAVLCHGVCTGHGPIEGVAFGHAWVEYPDPSTGVLFVIERSNGHDALILRDIYYHAGTCRDVVRYSPNEARAMMAQTHHFGPWHELPAGVR